MNVQNNGIYDLLKQLEIILEKSFPILPNYLVAIKLKEVEAIVDSIYGSLPQEIQEARRLLRRKEELQMEAQQKEKKIVLDAFDSIKNGKIIVVISHDLETITNSDNIYVLKNQQIIEEGTHEQLIDKPSLYKKLFNDQQQLKEKFLAKEVE